MHMFPWFGPLFFKLHDVAHAYQVVNGLTFNFKLNTPKMESSIAKNFIC